MKRISIHVVGILCAGTVTAFSVQEAYIVTIVSAVPGFLGVLLAGLIALLALLPAVLPPFEIQRGTDESRKRFLRFLSEARGDATAVFASTMVSMAIFVLVGIPTPLAVEFPTWGLVARRLPVLFDLGCLWVSTSATWDVLQSLYDLQKEQYGAQKSVRGRISRDSSRTPNG